MLIYLTLAKIIYIAISNYCRHNTPHLLRNFIILIMNILVNTLVNVQYKIFYFYLTCHYFVSVIAIIIY